MGRCRLLTLVALLAAAGLISSGGGPTQAAATKVWTFPPVKYVAQSNPTFSVDVRAEEVATPEMHVSYAETNVNTDLGLGTTPDVRASYADANVDTDLAVGDAAAREARGQAFRVTAAGPVNRVILRVKKVGAPEDGLKVEVRTDSGGLPDGSPGGLLSGSMVAAGPDLSTAYLSVAFDLLTPPVLSAGTQYHLVVKRTSPLGPDPANYFVWGADTSSPGYADGAASVYNGTSWLATAPAADHAFVVQVSPAGRDQGFRVTTASPANRVLLWLKRVGSLTGTDGFLSLEIRDDSGGVPGALLATSTSVNVDLLPTAYGWVTFNLLSPPQLSTGTQYHLILKWIDDPGAANYMAWGADTSSPGYTDGAAAVYYGGSTWMASTPGADHAFEVAYACPVEPSGTGPCGLGGFEIELLFNPSQLAYNSMAVGPFLTSTGRTLFSCSNPAGHDPLNGVATYKCNTTGAAPLGPQGSGVLATATFTASGSLGTFPLSLGDTVLTDISNGTIAHTSEGGQVVVAALGAGDTDGDGCTDLQEEGDDPFGGGHRNPYNPWDFFDAPVPANADPAPNGAPNRVIDVGDVLAVLFYAFAEDEGPVNSNGVDYDSHKAGDWAGPAAMHPDGQVNSYDDVGRRYDRTAAAPPLFPGAPNGVIDIGDVLAALEQFGHDCT